MKTNRESNRVSLWTVNSVHWTVAIEHSSWSLSMNSSFSMIVGHYQLPASLETSALPLRWRWLLLSKFIINRNLVHTCPRCYTVSPLLCEWMAKWIEPEWAWMLPDKYHLPTCRSMPYLGRQIAMAMCKCNLRCRHAGRVYQVDRVSKHLNQTYSRQWLPCSLVAEAFLLKPLSTEWASLYKFEWFDWYRTEIHYTLFRERHFECYPYRLLKIGLCHVAWLSISYSHRWQLSLWC